MKFLSAFVRSKKSTTFKAIAKTVAAVSLTATMLFPGISSAGDNEKPILLIGASWANGDLPLSDDMYGPLGGLNIGLGSYLDLGKALVRDPRLSGYVINEAEAGASTVAHDACTFTFCTPAHWISFDQQLDRALRRVAVPIAPGIYNAKYVVVTGGNDCLHSNNYGVPQQETTPCTVDDMNAYVDRLVALGQRIENLGLIPVFTSYAKSEDLDLSIPANNFYWFIDAASYDLMSSIYETRIQNELPNAVYLDIWPDFAHFGDGIHPDDKTSRKAAAIIADYIVNNP